MKYELSQEQLQVILEVLVQRPEVKAMLMIQKLKPIEEPKVKPAEKK